MSEPSALAAAENWIGERSRTGEAIYFSANAHDPAAAGVTRKKTSVRWFRLLVTDIDFRGPAHKSEALPPDLAWVEANILPRVPRPTLFIDSGHGCYLVWALATPIEVVRPTGIERVHALSKVMQDRIRSLMAPHGFVLDETSEPSHLFRLPGSLNRKAGEIRRVEIVDRLSTGALYSLADLGLEANGPASGPIAAGGASSGPSAGVVVSLAAATLGTARVAGSANPGRSTAPEGADARTPDQFVEAARALFERLTNGARRPVADAILAGRPFATLGSRDATLQAAASWLAAAEPFAAPECLAEVFRPSLDAMAAEHPEDHLTVEDAIKKIDRAQSDLRPKKEAEAAQAAGIRRGLDRAAATQTTIYPWGGGQFRCDREGLWFDSAANDVEAAADVEDNEARPIWLASPIRILAASRGDGGEDWGRVVEVTDLDGGKHRWSMPAELLAGDGVELRRELLRLGARLSTAKRARELLGAYLSQIDPGERVRCVDRLGWHDGAYVLPDKTIGDSGERTVFQSTSSAVPKVTVSGAVDEWRDSVAALARGNSRFAFGISMALAGPLLDLAGEDGGGFHLRGPSSSSKTTILRVAASVHGKPSETIRTWRATTNGLEGVAVTHNDSALFLDELGQIDVREAGAAAYMLANGQGKARANRTGGARESARWRLLFLSSGEESLAARMSEGGHRTRTRAGQEIRMAEIPIDAGSGMGGVENLHGHSTPAAFAEVIKEAAARNFGAVWREWLRRIIGDRAGISARIGGELTAFVGRVCPSGTAGQVMRVARRFGLVAVAGEMATSYGLTGWATGEATKAAERCFAAWLEGFGGAVGQREDRTIIAQVRAFLEAHGSSRFEAWNAAEGQKIINRCGFRRAVQSDAGKLFGERSEGATFEYLILPEAFKGEVCAGIDHKHAARVLAVAGCLAAGDGRNLTQNKRLPGMGIARCYTITSKIWEVD